MSTKKEAVKPAAKTAAPTASVSKLRKGTGTKRDTNRIITIYGPFKSRKTTSISNLPAGRTKWIFTDPNGVPTMRALGRLPHPDDIYEPSSLEEFRNLLEEMVSLCEADGRDALGVDFIAVDSYSQLADWHQQDVAKATGQRFLGDDKMNNGWQQFNAEFGSCLDLIVSLSRYVTVIGIVHASAKVDQKKGEYSAFSLPPKMAERLGRVSNWILLKTFEEVIDDEIIEKAKDGDPNYTVEDGVAYEDVFFTKPVNGWVASANTLKFNQKEPGKDLTVLLEKDGLL